MERERRINWISLAIKVVIAFVLILLLIWIISKITGRGQLSDTFQNNISNMEKAATDYFKTVDLPQEKGKNIKLTLKEMMQKKLLESTDNIDAKKCDATKSYAKITREDKNYVVEVYLKCGKEEDTLTSKFSFKDCKNCGQSTNNNENNNSQNNNSSESNNSGNSNNANNSSSNNAPVYYEQVKETVSYSKWMKGDKTGTNIENKYVYYSIENKEYYVLINLNKNQIASGKNLYYTVKLNNVPNDKYYFTEVKESHYFSPSDVDKYLKGDTSLVAGESVKVTKDDIAKYYIQEDNITYKLYPYYRMGAFYVDVKITIKNKNDINYSDKEIAFIPIKLNIEFSSNEALNEKPANDYITVSYYRYVEKNVETIWSTESYVEGYTKTGRTK